MSSLIAVIPTAGVLFMFWVGMRALVQADRRERQAQARIEAIERHDDRVAQADSVAAAATDSGADADSAR